MHLLTLYRVWSDFFGPRFRPRSGSKRGAMGPPMHHEGRQRARDTRSMDSYVKAHLHLMAMSRTEARRTGSIRGFGAKTAFQALAVAHPWSQTLLDAPVVTLQKEGKHFETLGRSAPDTSGSHGDLPRRALWRP